MTATSFCMALKTEKDAIVRGSMYRALEDMCNSSFREDILPCLQSLLEVEKDERAKALEEAEIERLRKDQEDEIRIIRKSAFKRVRELIVGKQAANRVADERKEIEWLQSGATITDEVVAELRTQELNPLSVIELDEHGKEVGGLAGRLGIVGISFLVGAGIIVVKGSIREPLLKEGPGVLIGVALGTGIVAAMIAALFTLIETIESAGKRRLAMVGGVLGITVLILIILMVVADIMNW